MDTTTMLLGILIAVTAVGFAVCLRELRAMQRSVDTLEQTLRREITRSHEAQERHLLKIANRLEVRPSMVPPEDASHDGAASGPKPRPPSEATEKKAETEAEKEPETARAPLPSAHVEDEPTDSEDETKLLAKPTAAQIVSAKPEAATEKKEEPRPEKKAEAKPVDMTGVALAKMALGMKAGEASLDSDDELTIQAGARKS